MSGIILLSSAASKRVHQVAVTVSLIAALVFPSTVRAQRNFVYTNDDFASANTVSGFSVASNGVLTPVPGSPFSTRGTGAGGGPYFAPNSHAVTTVDNFLFVSNASSSDVSAFSINAVTGTLSIVAGSPFPTGGSGMNHEYPGISLSSTPDSKFLLAANSGSSNLTVFSIASSGMLTPIAGSPFHASAPPYGLKVSPNGKFLAVAEPAGSCDPMLGCVGPTGQVEMFSIAPNGSLTSLGVFPGENGNQSDTDPQYLTSVDIDCATSLLYGGEANVFMIVLDSYTIASKGALTPIPSFAGGLAGGPVNDSSVVLLSSDDKTLFVSTSRTIAAFSVASDGTLGAGSTFWNSGNGYGAAGMATSQDGSFLYVADNAGFIDVFSVTHNGALTTVLGSPFPTGGPSPSLAAYPPKACSLTVQTMIKPPATPPVVINPRANGKIPVAILSTSTFDAVNQVERTSLTFGHSGNETSLAFCAAGGEDVNGDGLLDLVCYFNTQQTGIVSGDKLAIVNGKTSAGRRFKGSEAIRTAPR